MQQAINYARQFLNELTKSKSTVALTGAGVSTASGIPDFRGPDGLYSRISQRTFEVDFFFSHTEKYYEIAIEHVHTLADKEPNITHRMLAELEKRQLLKAIITQNIDGLHQKAGSRKVIEFHGNVVSFRCTKCKKSFDHQTVDAKIRKNKVPYCDCGSLIRPDIVFFGDPIPSDAITQSQSLATEADVFIAMGSSLVVNPAAALPLIAKNFGAKLFIVNKGQTALDRIADYRYDICLEDFSSAVLDLLTA